MNGSESLRQSPSKHNLCLLKRDVFHFWCVSHIFKFQVTTAWWIVGKCLQASWCLPYNHSYLLMLMTKPIFIQQKPATCSNHLPTSARKQWLQRPVWLRLALVQEYDNAKFALFLLYAHLNRCIPSKKGGYMCFSWPFDKLSYHKCFQIFFFSFLFFLLEHFSDLLPLLPPAIGQMTGAYGLSASLCTSA